MKNFFSTSRKMGWVWLAVNLLFCAWWLFQLFIWPGVFNGKWVAIIFLVINGSTVAVLLWALSHHPDNRPH